jgi:malonate transporter
MLHILSIVLPVFGLIAIGYGARRAKLVLDRTGDGLSDYVFTIAVPALIFKTLTAADLPQSQPWGYWLSYFMAAAIVWTVAMIIGKRVFGLGRMDNVVTGFSSAQANTVMVGIPLILEAYGKPGAVPLFLLVAIHLPIMMSVATIMAEKGDAHWRRIARQLLLHPILLAIFFSTAFRLSGLPVPTAIKTIIDMLGASAIPCALFAMGIALYRYGIGEDFKLAATITALKLIVHPLLVYVFAFHVFTMPPVWAGVAVLFASSPAGVNAYLFAERYRAGARIASSAIALSTALSVITSAFWLAWLGIH